MTARALAILVALALVSCRAVKLETKSIDAGRMGQCPVFSTAHGRNALIFLFSGRSGWGPDLEEYAAQIARLGAVVVGVDLEQYLHRLAASDDGCHYLISEIEDASQRLEREYGFDGYQSPILAGLEAGGTLAYAALAQSPPATVFAAISVDPAATLSTRVPLCEGAPARAVQGRGFEYGARSDLPGRWTVTNEGPLPVQLAKTIAAARGVVAPTWRGDAGTRLLAALRFTMEERSSPANALENLPVIEYPTATRNPVMGVIYSGDGGWRDLDKQMAEALSQRGMPVVGVDSLRYFWREKPPERIASDLSVILRDYGKRWGASQFVLAGYSFGAGILPFAVNRLPQDLRHRVVQLSLLGLERTALFEISVTGWFLDVRGNHPILPELQRFDLSRVQCFYGEAEEDTLCRAPELQAAEIVRTTGGHHFDGDYRALADKVLDGVRRRIRGAQPVA